MKFLSLTILFFAMIIMDVSSNLHAKDVSLHYVVREPKIKSGKPPVIILLHGIGSNENDLFSFADRLPDKFLVISARGPYVLGPGSYAWYHADFSADHPVANTEEAEKSRQLIIRFIDELKEKYHFDETQVYLCGFSQGAIMSYSVGLTRPDKVKSIAIMSGRILDEVKPLILSNNRLKQLNVFISHGINDKVIAIHYARDANTYLKQLGIHATYKEYTAVHEINNEMLSDLVNWLGKK